MITRRTSGPFGLRLCSFVARVAPRRPSRVQDRRRRACAPCGARTRSTRYIADVRDVVQEPSRNVVI
eukprot:1350822-Prymnesium_polylepis.1